jgi:hypothetical protein
MSERTGGPTGTDPSVPSDVAPSRAAGADIDAAQPIVLGDGPFNLSGEDAPGAPQAAKSRARRIVLLGLLAVVVIGAGVLAVTGWQVVTQKDARLSTPVQIGSLAIDESADGKSTADYLTTALAAEVDLDKTVGAVYRDRGFPDKSVLFFGGTALIWSPANDLESAFGLIDDDQGAVTGIHDVDAGKLGGTMRCGDTETADGKLTVCGWADHGSLAVAMFPGRSETESATLLRQIRDTVQKRS